MTTILGIALVCGFIVAMIKSPATAIKAVDAMTDMFNMLKFSNIGLY